MRVHTHTETHIHTTPPGKGNRMCEGTNSMAQGRSARGWNIMNKKRNSRDEAKAGRGWGAA